MTRRPGLRILPIAAIAWATSGAVTVLPGLAVPVALTLWGLCVLGMLGLGIRHRKTTRARIIVGVIVVLACAAGAASASHVAVATPTRDAALDEGLAGGRAVSVEAVVVGKIEQRADGALAFDAIATALRTGARTERTRVDVSVRVDPVDVDTIAALDAGAVIIAHGTVRATDAGDRAVFEVIASRGVTVTAAPSGVFATMSSLRRDLVASAAAMPGSGGELIPGLSVGDTALVSTTLDEDMKASSLSHLTAVSGANCALVVGIAFTLASALGASRRLRVLVGVLALVGFILLVTPEPSVVRAGTMAAIAMLAVLWGRPGVGVATLGLAVTVLLVMDPWLSTSLGFALSAAATGALLVLARPLADGMTRWMPRPLALTIAVPLSAQLACGPLLVLIAPSVPLYGVLANVLAAPAAPMATVVGLVACLTPWAQWLQDGLVALAWLPASWIATTAHVAAGAPGGTVPWLEGLGGALALGLVGVAIAVVTIVRGRSRATRRVYVAAAMTLTVLIGAGAGVGLLHTWAARWTVPQDWAMVACDVGQGDAVLLRSAGLTALVDTGPDEAALTACLRRVGVEHVDLLVLTHFDVDHVGAASAVSGRVEHVIHGPADADGHIVLDALRDAGAQVSEVSAGASGTLGDARWRVIWPRAPGAGLVPGNDASIVVDLADPVLGRVLLLGDLSASPQRALLGGGTLAPQYDIVKVAHHGSADQSFDLYAQVRPALAVIPVGAENTYGHPRAEIIDALAQAGASIARSDTDGLIVVVPADGAIDVWREKGG